MGWNRKHKTFSIIWALLLLSGSVTYAQQASSDPGIASYLAADTIHLPTDSAVNTENPPLLIDSTYRHEKVPIHTVQQKNWEKVTDGLNYTDGKKKKKKEDKPVKGADSGFNIGDFFPYGGKVLQFVLFGAVIALFLWLIFKVITSSLFLKNTTIKNSGSTLLESLEDNLHETDLDKALREALEVKNYRLALRIYYLAIIKEMSLRRWIEWKRDKTNYEYVRELGDRPQAPLFRDLTLTFEKTWYGDTAIGETNYLELSPAFSRFIDTIRNTTANG